MNTCPETGLVYTTLVDYYDKFIMIRSLEHYLNTPGCHYSMKRLSQVRRRFHRRATGLSV